MTTPSTARKAGPYSGTGAQTSFPFTFKVFAASDVKVAVADSAGVETVLTLGAHYSVALNSNQETSPGGTITYPISGSPLPTGSVLSIIGDLPYDQPLDLPSGGNFSPLALENQLDRATIQIQQLKEQVDRSAKLPQTSTETPDTLVFNITRLAESADNLDAVASGLAAVNTVADDIADVNTVASNIGNVAAAGANIAAVVTVANDLNEPVSEIETVAGSIANINVVGGSIAGVNTVAGNIANVNTVAAVAADVETVADNVADVTNFADVYYGPSATDPTLRRDGSALQNGDLYFNTGAKRMHVFDGAAWVEGSVNAGTITVQRFSGNGSTTAFTLSADPVSENNTQVFIGGVYQQKDQYSVSGTTLTFTAAPPAGTDNIEVLVTATLALGAVGAEMVTFKQSGTGAVDRTAHEKLIDAAVSVEDFGVNTSPGVTDMAAALVLADAECQTSGRPLLIPRVIHIATPVTVLSEVVDTGAQMFTATSQATLAGNAYCRPEWWGAKGDYVPAGTEGLSGTGTNDYAAFIAAFTYHGIVKLSRKKYRYSGTGTVPRFTRSVVIEGCSPAALVASQSDSIIYVTTPEEPFYMGGVSSVELLNLAMICAKHGPAVDQCLADQSLMQGTAFRCRGVHLRGNMGATIGGDANAYTSKLLQSDGVTWTTAQTITDFSPSKTFEYVGGTYGRGLMLTKTLDALHESSLISNFGVGFVNWGADLTNIVGSRISSNGINIYDKNLGGGIGGNWGRLMKLKDSETPYNIFAPCILLDGSQYVEIDHDYYEVDGNQGVFLAAKSANFKLGDSQFDGVWRVGKQSHPFMLIDAYTEGCVLKDNYYAQYLTSTPKAVPPIRFINTASGNLHKREGFVIAQQKTSVFPTPDFSSATNAQHVVNFRSGNHAQSIITPTNFHGLGVEHGASVQSGKLVFWDGSAAGKFMAAEMPLQKTVGTLTINITAKTKAASADTQIFFTIRAVDNCGRTIQTIRNANISGFNDATFATVAVTYDMTANDMSGATKLTFSWQTDDGLVSSIYLS